MAKIKAIKRKEEEDISPETQTTREEPREEAKAEFVETQEARPAVEPVAAKGVVEMKHEAKGSKPEKEFETPEWLAKREIPITLMILTVLFLAFRLMSTEPIAAMAFNVVIGASVLVLFAATFMEYGKLKKDRYSIIPAIVGLLLLWISLTMSDVLLLTLFACYFLIALLFSTRIMKIHLAIILVLLVTAILFRVYPAFPDSNPGGNLASFDDPYYHYKHTERLYSSGDLPDTDYMIYPPNGRPSPYKFSYYFVVFLAQITGSTLHDMLVMYPLIMSAIGAIFVFLFMKELSGDWKTGALAGFFFATAPVLLTKSTAGAVEEDVMGMAVAMVALYFLAKSIKSKGSKNTLFAICSGLSFLLLFLSWKGATFLYPVPMVALGVYFIFGLLLDYDIKDAVKAITIIGAIVIATDYLFVSHKLINILYLVPTLFAVYLGFLSEGLRMRFRAPGKIKSSLKDFILLLLFPVLAFLPGYSEKQEAEERETGQGISGLLTKAGKNPLHVAGALFVLLVLGLMIIGVDNIFSTPAKTFERIAGTSEKNYLVDKTIQEQAALAKGTFFNKLSKGYSRFGISEIFAVIAAVLVPIYMAVLFLMKKRDQLPSLIRSYGLAVGFFLLTMTFVWMEARLAFSQSIGFILLGSMMAIFMPKSRKELESWKVIFLLAILLIVPFSVFYPHTVGGSLGDAWGFTKSPSGVEEPWVAATVWLGENVQGSGVGSQPDDEYILTWWDYGHAITALSKRTVIADPLQAKEEYIMRIARFFYNTSTEDEAMAWLQSQPWNVDVDGNGNKVRYVVLDHSLVGKASALAFLGTNYYEYPASLKDEDMCEEIVPCVNEESGGGDCCVSLNFNAVTSKGGSIVLERKPTTPVFGQYQLFTKGAICRPEYKTSLDPIIVVEDGERKTITRRLVYAGHSGLPYANGKNYDAFVLLEYDDGSVAIKLLSINQNGQCTDEIDLEEALAMGDNLVNMGFGIKLGDQAVPQIFVHVPKKWRTNMFTRLYLDDAKGLKYFKLVQDSEAKKFYPFVKIFKVTYPEELEQAEPEPEPEPEKTEVKAGDTVRVHYIGKLEDGSVFDTSMGGDPFEYVVGSGTVIKGFDRALVGMELGEEKTVTLEPSEAYGSENESDHPLAGKTLIFDLQLVGINNETFEESTYKKFDFYDPQLAQDYGIEGTPAVVWNCRYYKKGSFVRGEQEGEHPPGKEMNALTKLTCIFNEAQPEEICAPLGITVDENGTIKTTGDKEFLIVLDNTGQEACKPDDKTLVQVFYQPVCVDCDLQRPLIEELKLMFGDQLDVSYYCIGGAEDCLQESRVIKL